MKLITSSIVFLIAATSGPGLPGELVYFADSNLKAAVEKTLSASEPNATDMLGPTHINLSERGIVDLTGLEYAVNLKHLNLSVNRVGDISALSKLTKLTHLDLGNNQFSDISALKGLTNLTELHLNTNWISNTSALKELTNLTKLDLSGNLLSDISALSGLTNLTSLDLYKNPIRNITPLSALTNLTKLRLGNNKVRNIAALRGLTNLQELYIGPNQISDISALSGLRNLVYLSLGANQIRDISALSGLTNLTGLWMGGNQISDVSGLASLTNLTKLHLSENQIRDISALRNLTNLKELWLYNNQITDMSALSDLTNLTKLCVWNNQITDISVLSALTKIKTLALSDNQISDISVLSGLAHLRELVLNDNQISNISALSGLTNLSELELNNNYISDISALRNLTNLNRLCVSGNKISNISGISELINLKELRLDENPLNNTAYYTYLPLIVYNNPDLTYLTCSPNPNPLTKDSDVERADLIEFVNHFGQTGCGEPNNWCGGADLNRSGSVDTNDFMKFVKYWFEGSELEVPVAEAKPVGKDVTAGVYGRYRGSASLPRYQSIEELPLSLRYRIQKLYAARDRDFTALDEIVDDFSVTQLTVPEVVSQLSNVYDVLCGIEVIPWPLSPEGTTTLSVQRISLSLQHATPRQILDKLVALDPNFTWFDNQGIANIVMRQAYESPDYPLNKRIPQFKVKDRPYSMAFGSPYLPPGLFQLPEVYESLAIGSSGRWPREFEPQVSVDAVDATVREIINQVARQVGMSWYVVSSQRRYDERIGCGFHMVPQIDRRAFSSLRSGL